MFSSEAWLAKSGGFYNGVATQSLRLDDGSGAYLSRTPSDTGNRRKFTWSGWFKRGNITTGVNQIFLSAGTSSVNSTIFYLDGATDIIRWYHLTNSGNQLGRSYSARLRDTSAWYHIMFAVDTEVADSSDTYNDSNRVRVYLNGTELRTTDASYGVIAQNSDLLHVNTAVLHQIGKYANLTNYTDGYLAEVNFVNDAQLTPSSFGETKNGVWIPITPNVTYGATGFRLQFTSTAHDAPASENSADTDNIGADSSGQNNHWTASDSIDTEDCAMPDSPENNFCTLNTLDKVLTSSALSEGNLSVSAGTGNAWNNIINSTFSLTSGKWYWEVCQSGSGGFGKIGVRQNNSLTSADGPTAGASEVYLYGGNKHQGSTSTNSAYYGSNMYADGNIFGVALDMDAGKIWVAKNNTYGGSADPTTGNGAMFTNLTEPQSPSFSSYNNAGTFNFGQDDTFAGNKTSGSANATDSEGIGQFYYAPPSGFLALCSSNLPEPTISPNADTQADDHFETILYSASSGSAGAGSSTPQDIGGLDFKPDWVWIKGRSYTDHHALFDSSRGVGKYLLSTATNAEGNVADTLDEFRSDGFGLGADSTALVNYQNNTYVSWNWKANGGTTSSNTDGSITSTVQANTDAGFSIVTYTGNDASSATVGHGLSQAPEMVIVKNRDEAISNPAWPIYHASNTSAPATDYLDLSSSGDTDDADTLWNDTAPSSTLVTLGTADSVNSGSAHVMYCFHSVEGYSKIGSYTGNGNNDGPMIFTSFRPAFIMTKRTNSTSNWVIQDSVRQTFNPSDAWLRPNDSRNEGTTSPDLDLDFLSNGFKIRNNGTDSNISGSTYIYMAFAEAPFKYANAR